MPTGEEIFDPWRTYQQMFLKGLGYFSPARSLAQRAYQWQYEPWALEQAAQAAVPAQTPWADYLTKMGQSGWQAGLGSIAPHLQQMASSPEALGWGEYVGSTGEPDYQRILNLVLMGNPNLPLTMRAQMVNKPGLYSHLQGLYGEKPMAERPGNFLQWLMTRYGMQ